MYPAPFDYTQAHSFEEVVDLLTEHGDGAKVLAGGQSLLPMMHLRLVRPEFVIDINGISGGGAPVISDGVIRIPALTRQRVLERSPVIADHCPLLRDATSHIGNIRVRSRGTVGGNLAHADPSSELACAAMALNARVEVTGPDGTRTIPIDRLFTTFFTTSLEPTEVISSIQVDPPDPKTGYAFHELARRPGDFAVVNVAVLFSLAADRRTCEKVTLSLGGVADRIVDATATAVGVLAGVEPSEAAFGEVARRVAAECRPLGDSHASEQYRRAMAEVFVVRALTTAVTRARELTRDG
ncbi:MAG: xanthine dehydrogenase family protein subunit M [Acidimicrobiia bacterium]